MVMNAEDNNIPDGGVLESLGQQLVQGDNRYVSVHSASWEKADRIFSALPKGPRSRCPMADQVWGHYYGSLRDKFGVMWIVNYGPPREE
jgi:PhnB protein